MDRFIDNFLPLKNEKTIILKSNMDRFIVLKLYNDKTMLNFKIQYG